MGCLQPIVPYRFHQIVRTHFSIIKPCRTQPANVESDLRNIVYVMIFTTLELCLVIDGASHFWLADGHDDAFKRLQKVAGAFAFIASILGYYTAAHYFLEDALGFALPMGNLSGFWNKKRNLS